MMALLNKFLEDHLIFGDRWPIESAVNLSYFAFHGYFARVFAKHIIQYETLAIHFHISFKFRVCENIYYEILLTFCENDAPGTKLCEM